MSFSVLSAPLVLLGLAALAGALFLLQRLRVRHREVEVPTVLFWREAIEEARARVLVQRFRHPLAYLLFLAIVSLLWLALAGPRSAADSGREYLILLDRSAAMEHPGRFDAGLEALRDEVERLPRASTRVIDCGPHPRTLLAPGEDALLLDSRLASARPAAAPATIVAEIRRAAAVTDPGRGLEVVVCGDAPVASEFIALLPMHVEVRRAGAAPAARPNTGITAFGSSFAKSGRWDRVDALVVVQSADAGRSLTDLGIAFTLDGAPLATGVEREGAPGTVRFLVRDLPAAGGLLRAQLTPGDALTFDDAAALTLPERSAIRVALSPPLADALGPLLALDPAVQLTPDRPDVAILLAGEQAPAGVPALEFVASESRPEAFLVRHTGGEEGTELASLLETLGLTEIDVTELASELARPIALGLEPSDQRGLAVWAELLSDRYNFTRSRAFPLFIAGSVRWLAGTADPVPFACAGEPVFASAERYTAAGGAALDPVGAAFVPPGSGIYTGRGTSSGGSDAPPLAVSLLDANATTGAALGLEPSDSRAPSSDGWDATTWLALLAFALLALEWILYRSERVP